MTRSAPRPAAPATTTREHAAPAPATQLPAVLALAMFAAQAPGFVLPPVVAQLADDLGVSVGAIGALRGVSGLAAAVATVLLVTLARSVGLRDLLAVGLGSVAVGSALAGVATGLTVLIVAHVVLGLGLATVLTSALAAAKVWGGADDAPRLLSAAMMGPPAAAVLATLTSGLLAQSWRTTWLLVPCATSLLALAGTLRLPRDVAPAQLEPGAPDVQVWRTTRARAWALGELLAYAGWSAVVVYAGALFARTYGTAPGTVGLLIGVSAVAFMVGTRLARPRLARARDLLVPGAALLAIGGAALGLVRPSAAVSASVLAALGFVAGARSIAASAFGLQLAGRGVAAMAVRTTAQQLGYLVGAAAGGAMVARAGFAGLGVLVGTLFTLAAVVHVGTRGVQRTTSAAVPGAVGVPVRS
ncbi:MFS transporter [Actinotalea sp. M2MS4P-6]|uniref:MFS transporter n=1 Tax=Actinotalea sp. M2MS4P-6 TaxID=2983762 RepID=UPI0021E42A43|nr:MFS transporter [Actinotalea sp. M2MS4P-6]MCV2394839.1 MFS transporter [Actinotalea sp. M2MS4P-6]